MMFEALYQGMFTTVEIMDNIKKDSEFKYDSSTLKLIIDYVNAQTSSIKKRLDDASTDDVNLDLASRIGKCKNIFNKMFNDK